MLQKLLRRPPTPALLKPGVRQTHAYTRKNLAVPPERVRCARDAVRAHVKDNSRVYIHMGAAAPQQLLQALADMKGSLKGVETVNMSVMGKAPHLEPDCAGSIRANSFFLGENHRLAVKEHRADFNPMFFSEVPLLFRSGAMPLDVAFIQTSMPDRFGWCSLGTSVDCSLAAVQTAKKVICQINPNMPRTHGDGLIHINNMDVIVEVNDPLPELKSEALGPVDEAIGKNVASLIPNGATLQMGIGAIPNAVLAQLTGHKDLGIHTEMFSDGALPLLESGVVNNKLKKIYRGKTVGTFLMGSRALYDYVDDNPAVAMLDVAFVNDPTVIKQNPRVHAINSAIEVDFTGQVAADAIGTYQYSGIGGQMDFMRGASLSEGGKAIIALPSCSKKGDSRIVAMLKHGANVVTTRGHVQYVVTEYGIAYLYGRNLRQRATALANIAHPKHREGLLKAAHERFGA